MSLHLDRETAERRRELTMKMLEIYGAKEDLPRALEDLTFALDVMWGCSGFPSERAIGTLTMAYIDSKGGRA